MSASLFSPGGLWRALTPADRLVCALVLLLSIAGAVGARVTSTGASVAIVSVAREDVLRLPLNRPGLHTVEGRRGPVTVRVAGGAVEITEAPCPHRLCVAMGAKRSAGDLIACVPSAVVIRLEGGRPAADAPDAVSR